MSTQNIRDVRITGNSFYITASTRHPQDTARKIEYILDYRLQYSSTIRDHYSNLQPQQLKATLIEIQEAALDRIIRSNDLDVSDFNRLIYAGTYGLKNIRKKLSEKKITTDHVDAQGSSGWTALHHATKTDVEMAKFVIDANPDLEINTAYGRTALNLAWSKEMIKLLLNSGAHVNNLATTALSHENDRTALSAAVHDNRKEVVEILLQAGADVNLTATSETPLQIAVQKGFEDIAALLMQYGAEI